MLFLFNFCSVSPSYTKSLRQETCRRLLRLSGCDKRDTLFYSWSWGKSFKCLTTLKSIASKNPVGYANFCRCNKQKSLWQHLCHRLQSKCDKNDTLLMLKIIVKILSTWTTLKIIVSKNPVGYARFLRCNKQKSPWQHLCHRLLSECDKKDTL